jgi:hypothetical protein
VNRAFGVAVNTRENDTDVAVMWLEFLDHILESPALNFVQALSTWFSCLYCLAPQGKYLHNVAFFLYTFRFITFQHFRKQSRKHNCK